MKLRIFGADDLADTDFGIEKRETVKRYMVGMYPEEIAGTDLPEAAAAEFQLWHRESQWAEQLIPRWVYELAEEVIFGPPPKHDLKKLAALYTGNLEELVPMIQNAKTREEVIGIARLLGFPDPTMCSIAGCNKHAVETHETKHGFMTTVVGWCGHAHKVMYYGTEGHKKIEGKPVRPDSHYGSWEK